MSLPQAMRGWTLNALLSPRAGAASRWLHEARRRVLRRPHVVSAFLQLDDPYAYLLAHYLPSLREHYGISLRLYLTEARGGEYQPAPGMLAEYAVQDCRRVARELGVPFLDKGASPPVEYRLPMLDTVAGMEGDAGFADEFLQALEIFWRGDVEAASRRDAGGECRGLSATIIEKSRRVQARLGHYNSAMLHYGGEWYWGVDRLHFLVQRLDTLARDDRPPHPRLAALEQSMTVALPVAPPAAARDLPELEYFHSVRSPYSYLGLRRIAEIADAFGLSLRLRPVLPMVMRGLQVPEKKLRYIVKDAAREARRRDVPFGKIADPLGSGVERALAVFYHAESVGRGRAFLLAVGEAVWASAVDLASDDGMRRVAEASGLDWTKVQAAMAGDDWRRHVADNRDAMQAAGTWGVPTCRLGDFVSWGQDRDWLLVRHIEECCDTGDGILI